MVWSQIDSSAEDLEKFAKHAGRKVVSTDDVLLLCRRNDALRELVEGEVERAKEGASGKRKRRA